ncbi:MAG: capsule biosynthesis protein [Candidatus Accumulibacter sp.]|nr:capsule biosynthesis protein [Accumulibacter sp.]
MVEAFFKSIYDRVYQQRNRLELFIIVIPMILLTVYYTLIASERYVSESRIVIKQGGDLGQQLVGLTIPFLGMSGGPNKDDAMLVMEFIHSPDLLDRLDQNLGLKEQFSQTGFDIVNDLPPWAKREDFINIYRRRVDLRYDNQRGVLVIGTWAKSGEQAQKLNQAILAEAEKFINELSHKIAREQLDFAGKEMLAARENLEKAKEALLQYQNNSSFVDPAVELGMTSQVIAGLQAQLAAKEVELKMLLAMMQENAPQVLSLRQVVASLRVQIQDERQKIASSQAKGLNRKAAAFLDYKSMVDFQSDVYRASLVATEKLRVEAARKIRSLAVISSPQIPERAEYPQRLYLLAVWLLGLCVLYGFVRLGIETIEDHRD